MIVYISVSDVDAWVFELVRACVYELERELVREWHTLRKEEKGREGEERGRRGGGEEQ